MSRADRIVEIARKALEEEINNGIAAALATGQYTIHGMSLDQIGALREKFINDTGLRPETLPPEALRYDGSSDQ